MTLHQRINLAVLLIAGLFIYYILFPILYPPLSKVFSKCASVPKESCQQQPYKLVQMGKPRFFDGGRGLESAGYMHKTYIPDLCDQCLSHIDFQALCYDYFMQDFKARRPKEGQGLARIDIHYRYISEYEWKSLPEYDDPPSYDYYAIYSVDIDPLLASRGIFMIQSVMGNNGHHFLYNDYEKKYSTIEEINERFNKKLVDSLPSGAVPKK